MKVLVTGANGFIGVNIVNYIVEHFPHWTLTCLVHASQDKLPSQLCIIQHDLSHPLELTKKFDVIIHAAACPSSRDCIKNPSLGMNNILHTFNILELCRKNKVPKLIFFSSCEVYGRGSDTLKESDLLQSVNMYGASKVAGEHLCAAYAHSYGIQCVALRVMNTWGPHCQPERFASIVQKAFETQECPHFIIETTARKRWIHVKELARKTTMLVLSELTEMYTAFNVVGDKNLTLEEFISTFGSNFTVEYNLKTLEQGYEPGFNADGTKLSHFLDSSSHIICVQNDPSTNDDIGT
jgi:nucleoside-diphosphate-sugar epimerase